MKTLIRTPSGHWSVAALFTLALTFSSCAEPRKTPFNEADFASAAANGSGVVSGQVYCLVNGNEKLTADVEWVAVVPVNAYTTENIRRRFIKGEHLQSADKRIDKYLRSATTDSEGHFTIRGVPPGTYYVQSEVTWTTSHEETDNDGIEENMHVDHEKLVYAQISVKNGQAVRVASWDQSNPVHDGFYAYGGTLSKPHHQLLGD